MNEYQSAYLDARGDVASWDRSPDDSIEAWRLRGVYQKKYSYAVPTDYAIQAIAEHLVA